MRPLVLGLLGACVQGFAVPRRRLAPAAASANAARCKPAAAASVLEVALRGTRFPSEAVFALLYAAPLPPMGPTVKRAYRAVRGRSEDPAVEAAPPPKRGAWATYYVLGLLAYALRGATVPSKVAFLFAGLRLTALPRHGAAAEERAAPRPTAGTHAAAAGVGAAALHLGVTYKVEIRAALLLCRAQCGAKIAALNAFFERALPAAVLNNQNSHAFRVVFGVSLALMANFWLTEIFDRQSGPDSDAEEDTPPPVPGPGASSP